MARNTLEVEATPIPALGLSFDRRVQASTADKVEGNDSPR